MKEQNFIARASEVVGFDNIYCQDPNKAPSEDSQLKNPAFVVGLA